MAREERLKEQDLAASEDLSFAAIEAYKMLRTKLNLMLPRQMEGEDSGEDKAVCRIVGTTSALPGEGKSTTAINLVRTMAAAKHRVCLIEADMRLPTLSKRLDLVHSPGLSNILTGQCSVQDGLQRTQTKNGDVFSVITAGDIPPTPSELLESRNMERLLKTLSEYFDFIIVDLPPVAVVTDALAVSKLLDGMLLIVRQNYCDRRSLKDVLYQFRLTKTKVIGIVLNSSDGFGGKGTSYRKDKWYGGHYYGYGDSRP